MIYNFILSVIEARRLGSLDERATIDKTAKSLKKRPQVTNHTDQKRRDVDVTAQGSDPLDERAASDKMARSLRKRPQVTNNPDSALDVGILSSV